MCNCSTITTGYEVSLSNPLTINLSTTWSHGRVKEDWTGIWTKKDGTQLLVTLPKDFRSDFASIPKLLRWYASPIGAWTAAAYMHDYHYSIKKWKRKDVDRMFYDVMLACHVGKKQAWVMYQAVRKFGWLHW